MTTPKPMSLTERLAQQVVRWRQAAADLRAWGADGAARAVERCAFQAEAIIDEAEQEGGA